MDKKPNETHENLIPTKLLTIPYSINSYPIINTNILYNWPALLAASCLNSRYTFSCMLIRIRY